MAPFSDEFLFVEMANKVHIFSEVSYNIHKRKWLV